VGAAPASRRWAPRLAEHRGAVLVNYALVNLCDNIVGLSLPPLLFSPTMPGKGGLADDLGTFFVHYELATIRDRWHSPGFWGHRRTRTMLDSGGLTN
jgi:hypothetical protein